MGVQGVKRKIKFWDTTGEAASPGDDFSQWQPGKHGAAASIREPMLGGLGVASALEVRNILADTMYDG